MLKLGIDRRRLYLLLAYLLFGFMLAGLMYWLAPGHVWMAGIGLIPLVVLTYEPFLKLMQEGSSSVARNDEAHFFAAFIELNEQIHKLTDIDSVLISLSIALRDRIKAREALFLIDPTLASANEQENAPGELIAWERARVDYQFLTEAFSQCLIKDSSIRTYDNAEPEVLAAFTETGTGIAVPVVQEGYLLAVVMIGRLDDRRPCSEFETQMYGYLANQLSIIFDRIRIYRQIMRKTALDHAEKMQVMQSLSANIAHEMRTPLSGIRASISGIENYLPELLQVYEKARKRNPASVNAIREHHLQVLQGTPDRIKLMIDQANTVIDMLLMNLRNNSLDKLEICMAASCIEQAVRRYPFKRGEKEKVHLELAEDFEFQGVELLFIYVIFNLLKNALYSIHSAQKGAIEIRLQRGVGGHFNQVHFRDGGAGMEPQVLAKIFDSFYTTKADGTGVGLSFCRRTLHNFGGTIQCQSVYGEYTLFTLELPSNS